MSLIEKPVLLKGSLDEVRVQALFDSGASYSCINGFLARRIAYLEQLPEPMIFETAETGFEIEAEYAVRVDFYFDDTERRFTDEVMVIEDLSEGLIIGVATMQKWNIRLDFEAEEVQYDRKPHRLRI